MVKQCFKPCNISEQKIMKPRKIEDKFQPELLKIQLIHLLDMARLKIKLQKISTGIKN
jgi:hypothetical protein